MMSPRFFRDDELGLFFIEYDGELWWDKTHHHVAERFRRDTGLPSDHVFDYGIYYSDDWVSVPTIYDI